MRIAAPLDGFHRARVVDGDWSDGDGPLDLLSAAVLLGARAWMERELHRVVGGWTRTAGDGVAVLADRLAMAHARRGEVLYARLPQLRELPADSLVTSPGERTDAVVHHLVHLDDDGLRLAAWAAVSAEMTRAYEEQLRRCTPVADAPLLRCLPPLLDELARDRAAVEAVGRTIDTISGVPDGQLAALLGASARLTA
jgi:hypothetical protein